MRRIFSRFLALSATIVGATVLTPACVDPDTTIFIRTALAPSTNRQNNVCQYTNDPQQPMLLEGQWDVGLADSYTAVLLVGNQLIPRGDPDAVRAESSRVHINGVTVRVTNPDGSEIHEFTSVASGFADPQQNNQPGYGLVTVTAVDAEAKNRISIAPGMTKLVIAVMRVFGTTLGGEDVESGDFQLPIRVCNGCLVIFSGDCASGIVDTESDPPCSRGQDGEAIPCQLCQDMDVCKQPAP